MIWQRVLPRTGWNCFFSLPVERWVLWDLENEGRFDVLGGQRDKAFGIICWFIWKNRNETIFTNNHRPVEEIISTAIAWTKSLQVGSSNKRWATTAMSRNMWQKPLEGWIKINVDGSLSRDGLSAAIGGLERNSKGSWLFGFQMNVYATEILQIEPAAILMGLQIAWSKGFKQVELESDNAHLVDILHSGLAPVSKIVEMQRIHDLCRKD